MIQIFMMVWRWCDHLWTFFPFSFWKFAHIWHQLMTIGSYFIIVDHSTSWMSLRPSPWTHHPCSHDWCASIQPDRPVVDEYICVSRVVGVEPIPWFWNWCHKIFRIFQMKKRNHCDEFISVANQKSSNSIFDSFGFKNRCALSVRAVSCRRRRVQHDWIKLRYRRCSMEKIRMVAK